MQWAVHAAAERGRLDAVELLLECGATVDARGKIVRSSHCLHVPFCSSQLIRAPCVCLLYVERGDSPDRSCTKASACCRRVPAGSRRSGGCCWQCTCCMLDCCGLYVSDQPASAVDQLGRTALIRAAEKGHVAVMECLLAHGADINARGYVCIDPIRAW